MTKLGREAGGLGEYSDEASNETGNKTPEPEPVEPEPEPPESEPAA